MWPNSRPGASVSDPDHTWSKPALGQVRFIFLLCRVKLILIIQILSMSISVLGMGYFYGEVVRGIPRIVHCYIYEVKTTFTEQGQKFRDNS